MLWEVISIIVTIILAAIGLAGLAWHFHRATRDEIKDLRDKEIKDLRDQVGELRERTAGLQAIQDLVMQGRVKGTVSASGELKGDE